ncbi:hypothetical protein Nans01_28120 [Nocardiopsis ansamitocini]|uniref:Uncharacterized protein n=1 Tax=Nocardiopsis ansamitocini TaxID=1670832 RepID=A0A9W6P7B6_9ACTN|nr:hypothetical protein Nans01_28120 [Nocardiopsis ansamitocini]
MARELGLPEAAGASLAVLAGFDTPDPAPLPVPAHAVTALAPLACTPEDTAELVRWWPDESWPAAARWLVDACYARVRADLGSLEWVQWPDLTGSPDPRVRCAPVYAFAAAVPALLESHTRWGVPARVSAATLADVGRHVAKHRTMFDTVGLELPLWIALHYRGMLVESGRLQYEPALLGEAEAAAMGQEAGALCVRLHIPQTGPLTPRAVQESLSGAADVLDPYLLGALGRTTRVATCSSWLLDPQLKAYLPADSNIIAFQDRFTPTGQSGPGDSDVFRFVFTRPRVEPDAVTATTRLEKAALDVLARGGHWQAPTGWLHLPAPA